MSTDQTDDPMDQTMRFSSFRGECYAVHADGSGAWIGQWRTNGDEAQADCDAHDRAHHDSQPHARVEFK
ncbi:MAG: hypothetical protein R3F45_05530 [Gammaproteobacteria bacterium]